MDVPVEAMDHSDDSASPAFDGLSGIATHEHYMAKMPLDAKCRGSTFTANVKFIQSQLGDIGVQKVQEAFARVQCLHSFKEFKEMDWYPLRCRVHFLEAVHTLWPKNPKKIKQLGKHAAMDKGIIKFFVRFTMNPEQVLKKTQEYWSQYYTMGELEATKVDIDAKTCTVVLRNFDLAPIFCEYLEGYFAGVLSLTGVKNASIKEVGCSFKDGTDHVFEGSWE